MNHQTPTFALILPAAGQSSRFGGGRNKLLTSLAGRLVVARTFDAFAGRDDVASVLIATSYPDPIREALASSTLRGTGIKARPPVFLPGGATRAHSVLNALREVPAEVEWVAIHDTARPLVSDDLITRTFAAAREHGAAVPALPAALTIKQANGPLPAPVQRTLPRATLWSMQTPQIMRREVLLAAFECCPIPLDQITDDAQLLELNRQPVWLVPGEERNLKITTDLDLQIAEMILAKTKE